MSTELLKTLKGKIILDIYGGGIDMNVCSPGDILISRHGAILEYLKKSDNINLKKWPHQVMFLYYPEEESTLLGPGSRTDEGYVFKNKRLPEDHEIVSIIKVYQDED